MGSLIRYAVD